MKVHRVRQVMCLDKYHHVTVEHVMSLTLFGPNHSTFERRLRVKLGIVDSAMTFYACAISEKRFVFVFPSPKSPSTETK